MRFGRPVVRAVFVFADGGRADLRNLPTPPDPTAERTPARVDILEVVEDQMQAGDVWTVDQIARAAGHLAVGGAGWPIRAFVKSLGHRLPRRSGIGWQRV